MPAPAFSLIRYGEDTLTLPYIPTGSNGWVRRLEANGYPAHTFGRGYKGREEAQRWLDQTTVRFLDKHGWKWPDEIKPYQPKEASPTGRTHEWGHRGQYTLYWKSPHIDDWLGVEVQAGREVNTIAFSYGPALGSFMSLQATVSLGFGSVTRRFRLESWSREENEKFLQAFSRDPFRALESLTPKSVARRLPEIGFMEDSLATVIAHRPTKSPRLVVEQAVGVDPDTRHKAVREALGQGETWFSVGGALAMGDPALAAKAVQEGMPYLEKLFDVFANYGVGIQIARYDNVIKEVVVRVVGGTGVDHEHTITFSATGGVGLTCGFQEDEERWLAHETRQAKRFFEDLEDDDDDDSPQWDEYTIPTRRET